MAGAIIATCGGWIVHESKGSSRSVHVVVAAGIVWRMASTVVIAWGTYVMAQGGVP